MPGDEFPAGVLVADWCVLDAGYERRYKARVVLELPGHNVGDGDRGSAG